MRNFIIFTKEMYKIYNFHPKSYLRRFEVFIRKIVLMKALK